MEDKETVKTTVSKNKQGYGYKYTDLAQIHDYLEANNMRYYQYVERIGSDDYIYTVPIINNEEKQPRRGVKIVDATLQGNKNLAQEQGSATTYARRYSLLMAFGLATEDDDARNLTKPNNNTEPIKNGNKKISLEQVVEINNLILDADADRDKIKEHFKINDIVELPQNQFELLKHQLIAQKETLKKKKVNIEEI